jgi:hypothetical protein
VAAKGVPDSHLISPQLPDVRGRHGLQQVEHAAREVPQKGLLDRPGAADPTPGQNFSRIPLDKEFSMHHLSGHDVFRDHNFAFVPTATVLAGGRARFARKYPQAVSGGLDLRRRGRREEGSQHTKPSTTIIVYTRAVTRDGCGLNWLAPASGLFYIVKRPELASGSRHCFNQCLPSGLFGPVGAADHLSIYGQLPDDTQVAFAMIWPLRRRFPVQLRQISLSPM